MTKFALVTGGSGGLGGAICKTLAQSGYHVFFTYHSNALAAEQTMKNLPGDGHKMFQVDVREAQQVQALANAMDVNGLNLLVNCAGMTRFVPHDDLSGLDDGLIDRIFQVNVRAPFAMVRAMQRLLVQGKGCVVNISSIAARTAMGSNIAYCASKAALDNMTCSLARVLAPDVRVLSIAPGLVDTEFVEGLDTHWRNQQEVRTALRRLAQPEEVAQAVLAAAGQLTFSTGTVIAVDGGRPLM